MPKLSIVIVAYANMDCLAACLESIPSEPWIEVIVVNNTHQNRGFGAGCNVGARLATGSILLFLNPDCVVNKKALTHLVDQIESDKSIGIIGPALTDRRGVVYSSCNAAPSRKSAPVVYSGLNRIFQKTALVQSYWYHQKAPTAVTEVGSVSGAAMVMRKAVFEAVGRFDEAFFLYWEELDLAMRIRATGKRILFDPGAAIIHEGALSTIQPRSQVMRWFRESRVYFFKKHFGWWYGLLLEGWLTVLEEWRFTIALLLFAGISYAFFVSGWWLPPVQLRLIQRIPWLTSFSLTYSFWLSVMGTVMCMGALFNELPFKNAWKSTVISFVAGLLLLATGPVNWPVLITTGILWAVVDISQKQGGWRKVILSAGMVWSVGLLVFLLTNQLKNVSYWGRIQDWNGATALAKQLGSNRTLALRCVGCTSVTELKQVEWQFTYRGITFSQNGEPLYLILPPFSNSDSTIPDTMTATLGSMKLAWPLYPL